MEGKEEQEQERENCLSYLPTRARKGNARNKRVIEICNIDPEVVKRHSFSPTLIAQTLDGVELLQRRPAGRIHKAKEEEKRNDGFGLRRSLNLRGVVFAVDSVAVGSCLQVGCVECADDAEDDDEEGGGDEELGSAAPFVRVDCAEHGAAKGDDVLHAVEEEARVVAGDAYAAQEGRVIVRDGSVAGPLAEKGHGEDEHGPVSGFARVEELAVVPPALIRPGGTDVLDHFFVFEFDNGGVAVAFAVKSCHGV